MKHLKAIIIFSFFWGMCIPLWGFSQEILVTCSDWPPFEYQEGFEVKGTSTRLVRKVFKYANIDYKIKLYNWARSLLIAKVKPNTCIYTIVKTPERNKFFKWIGKIQPDEVSYAWKKAGNTDILVESHTDFLKYTVGVHRASMDHEYLMKIGHRKLQPVSLLEQNFLKIMKGRIDLMVGTEVNFQEMVFQLKLDKEGFEKVFMVRKNELYLACNRKMPISLIQKIKDSYERIKKQDHLAF